MRRIISAAACIWLGFAGAVSAQQAGAVPAGKTEAAPVPQVEQGHPSVVVELFTSQGCAACPPADSMIERLRDRPDVIPLALHVDYWDYIGWADTFGSPVFTARQKAYARAAGSRTIYTPQMIIEGVDRVEGPRPMDVIELIQKHRDSVTPVALMLRRKGDTLRIDVTSSKTFSKKLDIQLVRYRPKASVDILRGENAGRTITYYNIVTAWQTIADLDGAAPMTMTTKIEGKQPVVVIVQEKGPGPILAAAQLR